MEDTAEVEVKTKNKKKTGDGLRRAALKGRVSSLPKHSARDALIEDAEVEFSLGQQPQRCSWPPKGGEGEGREASERLKELMRLHAERKENSEKRLQDLAGSAEDAEMLAVSVLRREANEDADNKPVKSILRTTLQRIKIRKRETLRRMPRGGGGGEKKKVSFSLTPEQEEREVEKKRSFKERERAEMALLIQYVLEIKRRKRAAGVVAVEGDLSDGESASEQDVMKLQVEIEALEKYQKEEIAVQENEAELLRIEEEIKRLEAEVSAGVGGGEVVQAIAEGEGYTPTATPPTSSEEDEEIRRIQEEIKRLEAEEAASAASSEAASSSEQSGGDGGESAREGETAELEEDLFRKIELQIMAMNLVRAAEEEKVASPVVEERKVEGVALTGEAESKVPSEDTSSKEVQEGNEGEGEEDDEDIKQIREEIKSLEAEMESYKAEAEEVEAELKHVFLAQQRRGVKAHVKTYEEKSVPPAQPPKGTLPEYATLTRADTRTLRAIFGN